MNLDTLKTLLIDGDGVLWRGDEPMPGLLDFFAVLRARGIEWALLTNNNTRTVDAYVKKTAAFGIEVDKERIFTSSTVTAAYLKKKYGYGRRSWPAVSGLASNPTRRMSISSSFSSRAILMR